MMAPRVGDTFIWNGNPDDDRTIYTITKVTDEHVSFTWVDDGYASISRDRFNKDMEKKYLYIKIQHFNEELFHV